MSRLDPASIGVGPLSKGTFGPRLADAITRPVWVDHPTDFIGEAVRLLLDEGIASVEELARLLREGFLGQNVPLSIDMVIVPGADHRRLREIVWPLDTPRGVLWQLWSTYRDHRRAQASPDASTIQTLRVLADPGSAPGLDPDCTKLGPELLDRLARTDVSTASSGVIGTVVFALLHPNIDPWTVRAFVDDLAATVSAAIADNRANPAASTTRPGRRAASFLTALRDSIAERDAFEPEVRAVLRDLATAMFGR